MEGPSAQAVRRILAGQPLYGPPTLDYVPPVYTPLYFYIGALVAQLTSPTLLPLRLVSLLASLGSAMLIGHLVWRETRQAAVAALAAAVFIGSTRLASTTLDLARTDALSLFWVLGALHAARSADLQPRSTWWLSAASGVLTGLAILTKQTAALIAVALVVHAIASRRVERVLAYTLGVGVTAGLAGLLLVADFGTWPVLYLSELPRQHALQPELIGRFWTQDVLPAFAVPLVIGAWFLLARRGVFWLVVVLALVAMGWGARLNVGSAANVLLPAYAGLAVLFGLGLAELLRRLDGRLAPALVLAVATAQLLVVGYNPRQTSPLRSDGWAGDRLVSTIGSLRGVVFGPQFGEFQRLGGKGDQAYGTAVMELVGGFGGEVLPEGAQWLQAYAGALRERRYDELLLDPELFRPLKQVAEANGYVDTGPLFGPGDEFTMWSTPIVPNPHVWVPRERLGVSP
jgi:4-amino-4-deoxy-L-arabinose transferase-like glycosyltransferase